LDKPRNIKGRKRLIRILVTVGVLAVGGLITLGLSKLQPAAPGVEWGTLWPGTVKRGEMVLDRRGLGTLVPEEILWIPAVTEGRIEKRLVLPGTMVKADTVLIEMDNPDLKLAAADAEWAFKASEADLNSLRARLESSVLDQRAVAAQVLADFQRAKTQNETDVELSKSGLVPDLTVKMSRVTAEGWSTRHQIETERVEVMKATAQAQIAAQQAKVEQLRALWQIKKNQVESLKVRAGADGVMQELLVQVGQRVPAGTPLAKVAQPTRLKAELKIPETQAKDIAIGQKAEIDTQSGEGGMIYGHVSRIDPAVINGTRTVDVRLQGALPPGAVPDKSVDGRIEIERAKDVMFVERPVHGQANATITLFKIDPSGYAHRVRVKLGRAAVNTIEVIEGLSVGDRVILSDMSAQDGVDRIKLLGFR
jgi:HlyD family secretion protein